MLGFRCLGFDAWVRTESNRLNYFTLNQSGLRVEKHNILSDHLQNESENPGQRMPGRPVVLPSSFSAGPRFMQQKYQDAMAIVTKHGKPDLFLTFICNPN